MSMPAFGKDMNIFREQILNKDLESFLEAAFDHRRFRHVSKEGLEWLKMGLCIDQGKRATASQLLNHPWLNRTTSHPQQPIQCSSLSQTAILVRSGRRAMDEDNDKLMIFLFRLGPRTALRERSLGLLVCSHQQDTYLILRWTRSLVI